MATAVLTLHIRAHGPGDVEARVFDGNKVVAEPSLHPTVRHAIETCGLRGTHDALSGFRIWYEGCTLGLVPLTRMREDANSLA